MSAADVKNIFVEESSTSLPLDQLDYKFITQSCDLNALTKILKVLRSGKEGYYPDLIRHCEEKIQALDPKNRALRKQKPILRHGDLEKDEEDRLADDFGQFIKEAKQYEMDENQIDSEDLPPIRSGLASGGKVNGSSEVNGVGGDSKKQKLKSWDYKGWDKFNVEEECSKIDETKPTPITKTSTAKPNINHMIDTKGMTTLERQTRSVHEKDKGNESFKIGEMEEAIAYYSRSINLYPLVAAINNRALVYLKQKEWEKAKNDCNDVLKMPGENENIKAFLRRATAYKHLEEFQKSFDDLKFVLEKEPNNARAITLLSEVEQNLEEHKAKNQPKGRTMKIIEVENDESDSENEAATPVQSFEAMSNKNNDIRVQEKTEGVSEDPSLHKNKAPLSSIVVEQQSTKEKNTNTDENKIEESMIPQLPIVQLPSHIEAFKTAGSASFKIGQYSDAYEKYSEAITNLGKYTKGNESRNKDFFYARAVLHNNRAACCLKMGNDQQCLKDCNTVLEIMQWDFKALTRRGCAYEHMEKYKFSYRDFKSAQSMNWSDPFVTASTDRVAKHLRDIYGSKWREKLPHIPLYPSSAGSVIHPSNPVKVIPEKASGDTPVSKPDPSQPTISTKELKKQAKDKQPEIKKDPIEEKKEKIRRNLFDKLKFDGNNLVKMGKYHEAVDCYTKCMTMCPDEPASYTNRALCFLKLKKPISAVNDCTKAIELDPNNVKAYFRRATARKSENFFRDAENDLVRLLEIEPENALAKKELKVIRLKIKSNNKTSPAVTKQSKPKMAKPSMQNSVKPKSEVSVPKLKKKIIIEEVSSSDEDQEKDDNIKIIPSEKQEISKPPGANTAADEDKKTPGNMNKIENKLQPEKKPVPPPNNDLLQNTAETPKESIHEVDYIRQPYEFGNQWNSVQNKNDITKYKAILDKVVPGELHKLLSNKTDDHVINVVALVCADYLTIGKNVQALQMMKSLAAADRFSMAGMFMSSDQKMNVRKTINLFKDEKDIQELLKVYKDVL